MKIGTLAEPRYFGLFVSGISVLSIAVLLSISIPTALAGHLSCPGTNTGCTILGHIPYVTYAGIGVLLVLTGLGIYVSLKAREQHKTVLENNKTLKEAVKGLKEGEKTIYDFVVRSDGTAFQSDVIKNLGFSKVKASRLLDRLEARGILERRRRGMTNLVVLKR